MKWLRPFVSIYLVLCLVAGGAVALSPTLHWLVEHGGRGFAHAHVGPASGTTGAAQQHQHGDGNWHSHAQEPPRRVRVFQHTYESAAPREISLAELWHKLAQFLEAAGAAESAPSSDAPGHHHHHSLFEALASGLVDQPLEVPPLPSVSPAAVLCQTPATSPFVARQWDAQSASRGPPAF